MTFYFIFLHGCVSCDWMIINYGLHILEQLDQSFLHLHLHLGMHSGALSLHANAYPCKTFQWRFAQSFDFAYWHVVPHHLVLCLLSYFNFHWVENLTLHGSKKSWSRNWESIRIMVKLQCSVVENSWEPCNQTSVHFCNWGVSTGLQIWMCTLRGTKLWIFWTTWSLNAKVFIITIVITIWRNRITNIKCALILILL